MESGLRLKKEEKKTVCYAGMYMHVYVCKAEQILIDFLLRNFNLSTDW